MAAGTWTIYSKAKKYIGAGTITLGAGLFKMSLHTTAGSANVTNVALSTLASLGSEITAQGGYAANGRAIGPSAGKWSVGTSARQYKFYYTTLGIVFTASGASLTNIRYAVLHFARSASDTTRRLLCYVALSTSQFSVVSPNTLTILPASTGVFTLA